MLINSFELHSGENRELRKNFKQKSNQARWSIRNASGHREETGLSHHNMAHFSRADPVDSGLYALSEIHLGDFSGLSNSQFSK